MRTTLTLDDDILDKARMLADQKGVSLGCVVSELARRGLRSDGPAVRRNGIRLFPVRNGAGAVTPEIIKQLAEETD